MKKARLWIVFGTLGLAAMLFVLRSWRMGAALGNYPPFPEFLSRIFYLTDMVILNAAWIVVVGGLILLAIIEILDWLLPDY